MHKPKIYDLFSELNKTQTYSSTSIVEGEVENFAFDKSIKNQENSVSETEKKKKNFQTKKNPSKL